MGGIMGISGSYFIDIPELDSIPSGAQLLGGKDNLLFRADPGLLSGTTGQRYQFVSDSDTTYTVPASAVTDNGRTIIELSNNSLTSITINTATGTGKVAGDSVNISITGTYGAQVLVASGVTLQGDLTFSYQYQTKTLIYKGSNVWKVVG